MAKKATANPKLFWNYVQPKARSKADITDLYKDLSKSDKTTLETEKEKVATMHIF